MPVTAPLTAEKAWEAAAAGEKVIAFPDGYGYAPKEPAFIHHRFTGLVVDDRERNFYDDSDFYAVVWDAEKGEPFTVEWGTTRFPTIGYGYGCAVDATPEVAAAYADYLARKSRWHNAEADYLRRTRPRHGVNVTLIRDLHPRGKPAVPKGTTGDVFWVGPGFRKHSPDRVGVRALDGSRFFAPADALVVHFENAPGYGAEEAA